VSGAQSPELLGALGLGFGGDGTGVQNDEVGFLSGRRLAQTRFFKRFFDLAGLCLINSASQNPDLESSVPRDRVSAVHSA
jgi:hypothetical protein